MNDPLSRIDPTAPSVPLRKRLLRIAFAGIVPLALVAGAGLAVIVNDRRDDAERTSLDVARVSAATVETELGRSLALLRALAQSPMLDGGHIDSFRELTRRVLPSAEGWQALVLAQPDGTVLMHTDYEPDAVLPPILDREAFAEVVRTGEAGVGNLAGSPDGSWRIELSVPVQREGDTRYVLTAIMSPEQFRELLRSQRMPEHWLTSVFDARNRRIARSHLHFESIGQPPSQTLLRMFEADDDSEGIGITQTIEGVRVYTAYVRIPQVDWWVAVGIPTREVEAAAVRAFSIYGGGLLLSVLIALAAALFVSRRITRPMLQLHAAARIIGRGGVPSPPHTEIQELQEVGRAMAESAAARRASANERDAIMTRLEHAQGELQQQVTDLQRLHQVSGEVLRLPTLHAQLQQLLEALCAFHGSGHGVVCIVEPQRGGLTVQARLGLPDALVAQLTHARIAEGPCGVATAERRRVVVPDLSAEPRYAAVAALLRDEGLRAVHSTPLRSSSGAILGTLAVYLDTPRRPSERELRLADLCAGLASIFVERARAESVASEFERRLHVALDSSAVPFTILLPVRNDNGQIVDFAYDYLNQAAARALQRSVTATIGRRVSEVAPASWKDSGLMQRYVAALERQAAGEFEFVSRRDGQPAWYQVVATPFPGRLAVWFTDISERKRNEQLLQEADRRKDEFLATLAHELRNPLAPIRQAALIFSARNASDEQKRWSRDVIERQVRHMALLLDDLLDVSRITRGKLQLRRQPVTVGAAIEAALETTRPLLDDKRLRLTVDVPEEPLRVAADPLRLAQIIANLLANAAKYTDPGGTVTVRARREGEQLALDVEDTGIGIDAEHLDAIFEMFAQVRDGSDRSSGGLGIGLALAQGLAQLHGGSISAASEGLGRGSRFTVRLPIDPDAVSAADEVTPAAVPAPPVRASALRVLVADDNRDAAKSLAELLRLVGVEVQVVYDGADALAECLRLQPDYALLDIGMPSLSGERVAAEIRRREDGAHRTTLIAITGWGQARDRQAAMEAGFDHHLTKPVDPHRLLALIGATAD